MLPADPELDERDRRRLAREAARRKRLQLPDPDANPPERQPALDSAAAPQPATLPGDEYCLLVTSPLFAESRLFNVQADCLDDLQSALMSQLDEGTEHWNRGTLEIYFRDSRFGGERVLLTDLNLAGIPR